MKWLAKFISGLLVAVLFLLTLSLVLDSTIFSAQFMKTRAREANLYEGLANELPKLATSGGQRADDPEAQQAEQLLKSLVTPEYVQNKIEPLLDALETYLREGGSPPVLDLTDLGRQASAAGLEIPAEGPLAEPTTLGEPGAESSEPHPLLRLTKGIQGAGAIAAAILVLLLMLTVKGFHRLTALAKALLMAGILLLLAAALLRFAPGAAGALIGTDKNLGTLKEPLQQLISQVGLGVSNSLLMVGAAYGAAALVLGITGWRLVRAHEKIAKPAAKGLGPTRE